jgi:hypothetical protein
MSAVAAAVGSCSDAVLYVEPVLFQTYLFYALLNVAVPDRVSNFAV